MTRALVLAIVLVTARAAAAGTQIIWPDPPPATMTPGIPPPPPPPRWFVGWSGQAGGVKFGQLGFAADGGARLVGPLWAHARGAFGVDFDAEGGGGFWQLEGGLELHLCTRWERTCLIVGGSGGWERESWGDGDPMNDPDERYGGPTASGFIAIDQRESDALRLRLSLELISARLERPGAAAFTENGGFITAGFAFAP